MRALDTDSIILATHNAGKLAEIRELVEPYGLTVTSAADHDLPEPVEDGTTFEENAYIKAWAAAAATGKVALSDDSGLCVAALDGDPGIHTADWAEKPDGSGRDIQYAMEKVEKALNEVGLKPQDEASREGYFCAVLCLCWQDGQAEYFRGEAHGHLVWPPRGDSGFGYDPVFLVDSIGKTLAEISAAEKNQLSHRGAALRALKPRLRELL